MIHRVSEKIADFILSEHEDQRDNRDVLIYGTEVMISDTMSILIALLTGLLFGHFLCSLVFFVSFATLRKRTGGYHANTHLKCNIVFALNIIAVMLIITCMENKSHITFWVVAAAVFSGIVIGIFSPRDNVNKRLDGYSKRKNKIQSLIIYMVLGIIIVIFWALGYRAYSLTVSLSMLSVAIALMVKMKDR